MHLQTGYFTDQRPSVKVLALSWKQPYAGLMFHGKQETRSWPTKYRGWVLICSTKASYDIVDLKRIAGAKQIERMQKIIGFKDMLQIKALPAGQAIGIGFLYACTLMTEQDENKTFVQYQPGLFIHHYKKVYPIRPFAWKGQQGFTQVSEEILKQIYIL